MLNYLAKGPKDVLFVSHLREQVSSDKVHSLEVSNLGISFEEAIQDVAKLLMQLVAHFRIFYVRIGPKHVELDLRKVKVWIQERLAVFELLIISRMGLDLA